ncbi:MAG TPA: metal-dependent hydrolase [Vicinamibacterales bacterium]|nr:metal-dependent hydrolase [Vicinamibacterales bacterium]
MPSPIGHALGGIAAGWGAVPRRNVHAAIALATIAAAPDLDLLLGDHREWSHSVGAALIAGLVAVIWTSAFAATPLPPPLRLRRTGWRNRLRWAAAAALAWGSHVLLDWLGTDTRPPFGVMALWPFTRGYYESSVHLFPAVSRRYWLAEFWFYNLKALAVEVAILAPIVALVVLWSRRWRES